MRRSLAIALLLVAGVANASKKNAPAPAHVYLSEAGRISLAYAEKLLDAGRAAEAEAMARKALATDPNYARAHAMMGVIQARLQQPQKARAEFSRALGLDSSDGTVHNFYGVWQCESGDTAGADISFQTALQLKGASHASVLANAGRCALQANALDKARAYLRDGLLIAPSDRGMLLMLSKLELQAGRNLEARAFVQRSDALGADAATLALAARVEDASGDNVSAARYRQRLRDEFPGYSPSAEGTRQQ